MPIRIRADEAKKSVIAVDGLEIDKGKHEVKLNGRADSADHDGVLHSFPSCRQAGLGLYPAADY